jgi:hypothetical protein
VSEDEWMDEQSEAVQKAITEIGDEAGTLDADPQVLIAAGKAIEQLERDKAELVKDAETAIWYHPEWGATTLPPSTWAKIKATHTPTTKKEQP